MSDPYKMRFEQDRALRDAARNLLQQDMAFLRGHNTKCGAGVRLTDRAASGASFFAEHVADYASNKRGTVATGVALAGAAIALAIFRRPLMDALGNLTGLKDNPEPEGQDLHSDNDTEIQGDAQ